MSFKTSRLLTLLGFALVSNAHADPEALSVDSHYLNYDEAVRISLHDNVDLNTLREQEAALKSQSKQALAPNEPVFTYLREDAPSFSLTQNPAEVTYQITWTLGFPGKALANSASIRHQAEATSEKAVDQEITVMTSLSNSYVSFATNEAFYKFLLDEQEKDKNLIKLIEKRFAASQASKVDLLNAQVATQQIAQAILENRNDYDILLTQFRQIIHRPVDRTLFPKIPLKIVIPAVKQSFDDLIPVMLRNNHNVLGATRALESQESLVTNATLQALPDLQFTTGLDTWIPVGSPNGPNVLRSYTMGVGISVPIFFAFNELEGIHAASHGRAAAENQLSSQQLQAIANLQTAYTSLGATLKELDTSERLVVPAAKESFDLTMLTYGLGKADYLILQTARQAWHDASRDMLTKRQNAAQLYNQVITQMGCDIAKTEGPNACK